MGARKLPAIQKPTTVFEKVVAEPHTIDGVESAQGGDFVMVVHANGQCGISRDGGFTSYEGP